MHHLLVVDDDSGTLECFGRILRLAGYVVSVASTVDAAFCALGNEAIDIALIDLRLAERSGLEILRGVPRTLPTVFIMMSGFGTIRETVRAMSLGAINFLEKPIFEDALLHAVRQAERVVRRGRGGAAGSSEVRSHSATRWASIVAPLALCPHDLRTVRAWAHHVAVSAGAVRIWCRTADIGAKRSLTFGRLMRAALKRTHAPYRLEDLLNVTDRRTLAGLVASAGFDTDDFPQGAQDFLCRQRLVSHPAALAAIEQALAEASENEPVGLDAAFDVNP